MSETKREKTLKDKLSDAVSLISTGLAEMGDITFGELTEVPDKMAKSLHTELWKMKASATLIKGYVVQIEKGEFENVS